MASVPIEIKKTNGDHLCEVVYKACRFDKKDENFCSYLIALAQKKDTNTINIITYDTF